MTGSGWLYSFQLKCYGVQHQQFWWNTKTSQSPSPTPTPSALSLRYLSPCHSQVIKARTSFSLFNESFNDCEFLGACKRKMHPLYLDDCVMCVQVQQITAQSSPHSPQSFNETTELADMSRPTTYGAAGSMVQMLPNWSWRPFSADSWTWTSSAKTQSLIWTSLRQRILCINTGRLRFVESQKKKKSSN